MKKHLTTYYFIIASTKFFLHDEPVEEVFRERTQHYRREKKPTDFWFLSSPYFLESNQLNDIKKKLSHANLSKENCSAIISIDQNFIVWTKLRFNNVIMGSFVAPTEDLQNPLA
nr:Ycf54 [Sargassum ilicifolium var. conduplicatum]